MHWIDIFPTSILSNILSDITYKDISLYKQTILTEPVLDNTKTCRISSDQKILDKPLFSKILKHILYHSKIYLKEIGHKFEDVQIASSWSVVFKKNNHSTWHDHQNSYLSGVYYLTEGSEIIFKNPHMGKYFFNPELENIPESSTKFRSQAHFKINPQSNLMILFPSQLEHIVVPHKSDRDRIVIAFNIIPKGEFGNPTAKLYL